MPGSCCTWHRSLPGSRDHRSRLQRGICSSKRREFPEKELKRDWAARGPRVLVMFRFLKRQVKEFQAGPVSFPDKPVAHAARGLIVVGGPATIEIDSNFPLRLGKDALEQIVPIGERAREAGDFAEGFWPLPPKIEGNDTAQR